MSSLLPDMPGLTEEKLAYDLGDVVMEALRVHLIARGACPKLLTHLSVAAAVDAAMAGLDFPG